MTIEDFLVTLESRNLVPDSIVKQVREKVRKGDRRITPKSLLKYLVKKEYVTKRQAKELLETTLTVSPNAESSILGMAAMPIPPNVPNPPKSKASDEIPTIAPIDDDKGSNVLSGSLVTDGGSSKAGPDLYGEKPASLVAESLSKIGAGDPNLTEAIEESQHGIDAAAPRKSKRKKGKKNEWDSSLLLLGGGGLVLLILTGVVIGYMLLREDADALLAEASKNFDGGSYTTAINLYERFVENHTQHPDYSAAKVKLGMAKLWKATSGNSNFSGALETAQEVLRDIEDEEAFRDSQGELASLLPTIAQGLADQAERETDPDKIRDLVKQTNMALSLCTNTKYMDKKFRDEVDLDNIDQTLSRVERARAQNEGLAKALSQMQTAIDSSKTSLAYQVYDDLLDDFPGLIRNDQLAAKIQEISEAEASVVKFVAEAKSAETKSRPTNVVAELSMANRTGPEVGTGDEVVAIRVSGAVYGLNLNDGALRWRRFVGIAPQLVPLQLSDSELLVVDQQHFELLKLESKNGKLIWRLKFETAVSSPVLLGDQILVAESSGKLHVIDSISGERKGYVQFTQQLSTPPKVGPQGKRIYIIGEHSSLYTLSADDYSCLGVFFLNHSKGSVTTPPAVVLNKVIVAVAKGLSTSRLEVLNTNAEGVVDQRDTSQRLDGLVNTNLLSQGRRLVAVTTRGQVAVYEVSSSTGKGALTAIASRESESGSPIARFGLLQKGHVWVAGNQLSKLKILPTSDRLPVSTIDQSYRGDTFDHPLIARGDLLIHVRRPDAQSGAKVAAMSMESGESKWETEIAIPSAGAPSVDASTGSVSVVSASGTAYLIDRNVMNQRVLNKGKQLDLRLDKPLTQALGLGVGQIVSSASFGNTLLHFRPDASLDGIKAIELVSPVSSAPIAWDNGFVVPTRSGQVFFYKNEDGSQWGSPFQPPLAPGASYAWVRPAVFGDGAESKLVLSDGKEKIYLLSREVNPQPHLTAVESADINTSPLNTHLAVAGDLAIAGAEDGSVSVFALPSLAARPSIDIQAQVTWGPFTVGKNVVLATATEELICLNSQSEIVWRQQLAHGPPAGVPLANNGEVVLLSQQGSLSRLKLTDGSESAHVPLPQPAVAGPVSFGDRLIVTSFDGTLLVVDSSL